jgi:large repetitive protein
VVNQAPSFSAGPDQTVLEDGTAQTVAAWATAVSPGPPSESSQAVTFTAMADDPSLFSSQPAVAPNGTLTFEPAANAFGVATITVTAHDDGGTANGGVDTSPPRTLTITIAPVDDAPSFSAGPDQNVLEDDGANSISGWASAISAGPPNESSQTMFFTADADVPALFSGQPSVTPDGKLTYTPAPNANGVATVSVHLHDSGGTANGGVDESPISTFTITIGPVNDAPSFSGGGNQTAVSLLGPQTVPGWATAMTPGPTDESSQTLTFAVTNDNPGLFATQPAIAANGTLTYEPNLLALGAASVTVRLLDNGGTASGGVDTSPPQTFTITIL